MKTLDLEKMEKIKGSCSGRQGFAAGMGIFALAVVSPVFPPAAIGAIVLAVNNVDCF